VRGVVGALQRGGFANLSLAAIGGADGLGLAAVEARPHPAVPWTGTDVATAVLSFLGFQMLAAAAVPSASSLQVRLAAGSAAMLAATGVSMLSLRMRGATWSSLGCGLGRLYDDTRLAVGGVALLLAPLLGLAALLDRIVPYHHAIIDFLSAHRDPLSIGLVAFAAVVAAPIAEEFLVRRVLQGWLEGWLEPQSPRLAWTKKPCFQGPNAHYGHPSDRSSSGPSALTDGETATAVTSATQPMPMPPPERPLPETRKSSINPNETASNRAT
jgi:membrane protease YdiL (CAAX protease family)